MSANAWFQEKMATVKDSFEFRFEAELLALTEKICIRMEETGISRTKLSERLGITPAAITKLLRGNSNFTLRKLLRVADALEMDLKMEFEEKKTGEYNIVLGSLNVCSFNEAETTLYRHGKRILVDTGAAFSYSLGPGTYAKTEYENETTQVV